MVIYFAFIRPVLEYGDVVWGNCTKKESDLLEIVQIEAGRIIKYTGGCSNLLTLNQSIEGYDRNMSSTLILISKIGAPTCIFWTKWR
jgi:hypothetical protein